MVYKNFEEFNRKIRPYWGSGNFTTNTDLAKYIIEIEEKKEKEENEKCQKQT